MSWRIQGTTVEAVASAGGGPGRFRVRLGERELEVEARREADGALVITRDGVSFRAVVTRDGASRWVTVRHQAGETWRADEVHERRGGAADVGGALEAPMPAKVTRVVVAVGDAVAKGATLMTLEAMKMEHALKAPFAGVVREVRAEVGELVQPGRALVVVEEQEK